MLSPPLVVLQRLNANIPFWVCSLKPEGALATIIICWSTSSGSNPSQRWQQNNIISLWFIFLLRGKYVKCSENSLMPLWKVLKQRLLYRGNREFQNKKLSMFCVFILTFLWCLICGWLQLYIMYVELVKKKFLTFRT